MTDRPRSICLISGGMEAQHLRLQPWRYLYEVARQLAVLGHPVKVISDGSPHRPSFQPQDRFGLIRLATVSDPWWQPNIPLQKTLQHLKPDIILWHLGLTSFLHQRFACPRADLYPVPIVGILTSPLYEPGELARIDWRKLLSGYRLSVVHMLGSLIPRSLLRRLVNQKRQLTQLVVQTETTRAQFYKLTRWPGPIEVIPPGVDETWSQFSLNGQTGIRARLGYRPRQKVVVYFGSPAPLRGLPTLVKAFEMARRTEPALELLVLARRNGNSGSAGDNALRKLLAASQARDHIRLINDFLDPQTLASYVAAGDVVALPFELVPSDAPLSLLETAALGKPLVTTDVACLPELQALGRGYIVPPADPGALSRSLLKALRETKAGKVQGQSTFKRSWAEVGREWSALIQTLDFCS